MKNLKNKFADLRYDSSVLRHKLLKFINVII